MTTYTPEEATQAHAGQLSLFDLDETPIHLRLWSAYVVEHMGEDRVIMQLPRERTFDEHLGVPEPVTEQHALLENRLPLW